MRNLSMERIEQIARQSIKKDNRGEGLRKLPGAQRGMHLYYRFLFDFCREFKPAKVLELGVCLGVSGLHLARACKPHGGHVWGVDAHRQHIMPRLLRTENYSFVHSESVRAARLLANEAPFDVVFFDTLHVREQLEAEVAAYGPLTRRPGVWLFDNICANDLPVWWEEQTGKKARFDRLSDQSHRAVNKGGFGWIVLEEEPAEELSHIDTPAAPEPEAGRHLTASEARPYLGLEPEEEEVPHINTPATPDAVFRLGVEEEGGES